MKEKNYLKTVSDNIFYEHWASKRVEVKDELKTITGFFKTYIDVIPKTVFGEYYWQIFNNDKPLPKILMTGGAVEQLTPTTSEGLININFEEFFSFFHSEDRQATMTFIIKIFDELFRYDEEKRKNYNFNIITRIRNSEGNYHWNSFQYPALYFNESGNFMYGMVLYTNINHLIKHDAKPMLTILDSTNKHKQIFTCFNSYNEIEIQRTYPIMTKREKEILALLSQGNASKQIADRLGIAKNTVDNYRQRLLKKFRVSSSAELAVKALGIM